MVGLARRPGEAKIEAAISGLRGAICQVPSAVSAIKVDGVRSYGESAPARRSSYQLGQ